MTRKHLVYIPFRGVGIDQRDDKWFEDRIRIFLDYTLPSLLNQTVQDFTIWLSFRPQDKNSPLVRKLNRHLGTETKTPFVMTFDGLMYYDDKFSPFLWPRIKNCGRIIRSCWRNKSVKGLPAGITEVFQDKNSTLPERVKNSLRYVGDPSTPVAITRIDSDDMFHAKSLEYVRASAEGECVVALKDGYVYNTSSGELAFYDPKTNPPFHTLFLGRLDGYLEAIKNYKSHEDVFKLGLPVRLIRDERLYCVGIHNPKNHISTIWNHPFRGEIITEGKYEILKQFDIKPNRIIHV